MRKHMLGLVAVLAAFLLAPTAAFALADAGVVLMAKGVATAKGADGVERKLDRKSAINVGDTLTTGAASDVSLRMKDGTVIALGADTQFAVNAYSSKQAGDAADSAALKLVKGSLMQVSGSMDKASYKLETPVSTLGIRGTIFQVVVNADGTVTCYVAQGQIQMQKSDGTSSVMVSEGEAMQMLQDGTATMVPQVAGFFGSMAELAAAVAQAFPEDAVEFAAQLAAAFPEQADAIIAAAKANMTDEQKAALDASRLETQAPQAGADGSIPIQTGAAGAGGGVSP
jgi:hypothetical protein